MPNIYCGFRELTQLQSAMAQGYNFGQVYSLYIAPVH